MTFLRSFFTVLLLSLQPDTTPRDATTSADWPQWRGPNRDGICKDTGLLTEWPEKGPPLSWKATNCGQGYSAPTIARGKVFGMGDRNDEELVWALDAATGKEIWTAKVGPKPKGAGGGFEGPRCSPTVDGTRVYALGIEGDLICLETDTGKELWKVSFKSSFNGRVMSVWGYSESPLVDGDHLVVTPGGDAASLVALDKRTGNTIWKAKVSSGGGAGYASVMPATVGDTRLYITWLGNKLVGVAAKDGRLLFEYSKVANHTANIPTVVIRGNHVFCSTGYSDGGSALLKLTSQGNGIEAKEVWRKSAKELQNHHGGAVLVGDYLYFGHGHNNGNPVCVEFLTGKTIWGPERGPGTGSAAVLFADGHLYFRYQNGLMALLEATPKSRVIRSTFELPDSSGKPSWPHPVIAHGKLYIRDQDVLLCFDVRKK